jgi:hypothetical protein
VNLRTFQGTFDYFVAGPLHVSAGGLLYNGNKVAANLSVPSGQTFTLGGITYESATAGGGMQPIGGAGTLTFNKAAPLILVGLGIQSGDATINSGISRLEWRIRGRRVQRPI